MASSKEMLPSTRPLTHQRPSLSSSSASALTGRQSHARANSHSHASLLTGSLNPTHRVTRRKSVTAPGANVAALTAAIRDSEQTGAIPIATNGRRNTLSRLSTARAVVVGSLPSPPASLPSKSMLDTKREHQDSAIDDDSNELSADEGSNKFQKARTRRASDGQPLAKDGKKSNRVEVRCETCGKGYKHSSCLTKHLWEHTPEWSLTSKLLISKHQQVQLLEAASVLVAMNGNPKERSTTPPDSAKDFASEPESASPTASGSERQSSADTTPPPIVEGLNFDTTSYREKRYSSGSGFARSYQSTNPLVSGSVPNGRGFGHFRHDSSDLLRPTSSGLNSSGQDDHDLAAAVELLSCSFGSNNGSRNTVALPADAPPVPPLPAQYLDQAASLSSAGFINSYPSRQPESFTRGDGRRGSEDVMMEESEDDFDMRSRARSDEDDDGVFGRMEE